MDKTAIEQYVLNGGELFKITNIDTIRDGGTKVIKTNTNDFYIRKKDITIHTGYPTSPENEVDPPLREYIKYSMDRYVLRLSEELNRCIELNNKIQESITNI